jgi:hypothetical protein
MQIIIEGRTLKNLIIEAFIAGSSASIDYHIDHYEEGKWFFDNVPDTLKHLEEEIKAEIIEGHICFDSPIPSLRDGEEFEDIEKFFKEDIEKLLEYLSLKEEYKVEVRRELLLGLLL